jgi:hypothetical protein
MIEMKIKGKTGKIRKAYLKNVVVTTKELKQDLKTLCENFDVIPQRWLWRQKTQWLILNRIGIQESGRILFFDLGDNIKEMGIYTLKNFFLKPRLMADEEKKIMETMKDLMLLVKEKQKTLVAREITSCKNAEIRRLLLERFGYERFLAEMGGKTIHQDGDSSLIEIVWHKDEEKLKLVRVKDSSTERYYVLRVLPSVKTCRQAIAWSFGKSETEYQPIKET